MLEPNFNFYDGSRTFTWLADLCGLSVDLLFLPFLSVWAAKIAIVAVKASPVASTALQVAASCIGSPCHAVPIIVNINFLICQVLGLFLASLYRSILHPSKVSSLVRHTVALTQGLAFGYFCFGRQAIHIAGLPTACYIVIRTQNPAVVQRTVMLVSMIYLLCIHLIRQIYDYGSQSLDITGPLMIITQKVTSLAFSIHDGFLHETQHDLTKTQQYHAVKKLPSALEYFSYVLHFQSVMAGPLVFYRDYIEFIEGYNFLHNSKTNNNLDNVHKNEMILEPSPLKPVVKKLLGSIMCAFIFIKFSKVYPVKNMKEDDFVHNTSITYKVWYVMLSTTAVRFKYYHAWLLADAICNNSGLGFNGFDNDGNAKWDLISNIHVLRFEFATNMRDAINNWNIGTNRWLRSVAYERVPKQYGTLLTFALSAIWHGFYPGYYFTFTTGAVLVTAARCARRMFRNYFQHTQFTRMFYDILTCIATRLGIAYCVFPFVLLDFASGIKLYLKFYCCLHIIALAIMFILPKCMKQQKELQHESSVKFKMNDSISVDNEDNCKMTKPRTTTTTTTKIETNINKQPLVENYIETTAITTTNIPQSYNNNNNNNNNYYYDNSNIIHENSNNNYLEKPHHVKHDKCEMDELSNKFLEKIDEETKNIEEFIDKTVTETVSSIVDLKRELMRDPNFHLSQQDYENFGLRKRITNGSSNENTVIFAEDGAFLKKEIEALNAVVQQANNMLPAVLTNGHAK